MGRIQPGQLLTLQALHTGTLRVLRGGSWIGDGRGARAARRDADDPGDRIARLSASAWPEVKRRAESRRRRQQRGGEAGPDRRSGAQSVRPCRVGKYSRTRLIV